MQNQNGMTASVTVDSKPTIVQKESAFDLLGMGTALLFFGLLGAGVIARLQKSRLQNLVARNSQASASSVGASYQFGLTRRYRRQSRPAQRNR